MRYKWEVMFKIDFQVCCWHGPPFKEIAVGREERKSGEKIYGEKTIGVKTMAGDKSEVAKSVMKHKNNSEKKGISRLKYLWFSLGSPRVAIFLILTSAFKLKNLKIKVMAPFFFSKLVVLFLWLWESLLFWMCTPMVIKGQRQGLLLHGTKGAFTIILISQTCRCNYSWPASSCHP